VHTMSDAIKYMIRQDYEKNPGIAPGDIFINNDPLVGDVHNGDVQTLVPLFWDFRLPILLMVVVIASVGSHMPARFRYYSILRREVVADASGPGGRIKK